MSKPSTAFKELVNKYKSIMEDYQEGGSAAGGGVDTDELDSNVDGWEDKNIIPLRDLCTAEYSLSGTLQGPAHRSSLLNCMLLF